MIQDYISNFVALLNQAIITKRFICRIPCNAVGIRLASLLFQNGYVMSYRVLTLNKGKYIYIMMKNNAITATTFGSPFYQLTLISKPGSQVYWTVSKLINEHSMCGGLTMFVLSTSRGILLSSAAIEKGVGGKVLFRIN